jgi:hypothetical protein
MAAETEAKKNKEMIGLAAILGVGFWLLSKGNATGGTGSCNCACGSSTGTTFATGWGTGTFPASGTTNAF